MATLLPTSIPFVLSDYAIGKAGAVHVPSSSLEPFKNLSHKFSGAAPKVLICLDSYLDLAKELVKEAKVPHLLLFRIEDHSETPPPRKRLRTKGAQWAMGLLESSAPVPPVYPYNVDRDIESLLFTGGATGLPKGCMCTHKNIYANALQNLAAFGAAARLVEGAIAVLLGLPFFHSYGHIVMHTMTILGADQLLVVDPRDTAKMIEMVHAYCPVMQFGVPSQFMKLAQEALQGRSILGLSGSAPLPPAVQEAYEKKSGGGIMEGYGLSEMGPVTHLNLSFLIRIAGGRAPLKVLNAALGAPGVAPALNAVLRTAGTRLVGDVVSRGLGAMVAFSGKGKGGHGKRKSPGIPVPDTEIKMVDADSGKTLSLEEIRAGKPGELYMRGPQRMLGYWPAPGTGLDPEGYVKTGDVVTVDKNGYFAIVDRTKDMIVVSGYKVYSRELEDMLYGHPGVEMAAVVGVPDPEREGSERVAVYVQPKFQARHTLTPEEITGYLRERVAKYAVPRFVRIVDELPVTGVHKLDKKALRDWVKTDFSG